MILLKTITGIFTKTLIGAAILLGALTMYGDWLMIYIYWTKQDRTSENLAQNMGNDTTNFPFRNFQAYWIYTMLSAYGIYFTGGLLLHYYYYKLQRDRADEWKCQPKKWLSSELELDEIKTGLKSLLIGNTWSALLACYISNEGHYCNIYFKWDEYSLLYLVLQGPILFAVSDYILYWAHRMFHWPILYKLFHSLHHKYRQPTAFSSIALHPVEISVLQAAAVSPIFNPIFPIYLPVLNSVLIYFYVMGILNHSGIDFKPMWWQPWQAETMFHDNHHQYFHVNFGFNLKVWDRMHGTIRRVDRIYTERTFGGKGKSIQEASQEEKAEDLRERETENEKAYPEGYNKYFLFLKDGKRL